LRKRIKKKEGLVIKGTPGIQTQKKKKKKKNKKKKNKKKGAVKNRRKRKRKKKTPKKELYPHSRGGKKGTFAARRRKDYIQ